MKLYDVPRNTWVKPVADNQAPPGARLVANDEAVLFHHIDGMYSYCHDKNNNVVHLAVWADVEIVDKPNVS